MSQNGSIQLPSSMVAQEFGEVNIRRRGQQLDVHFTLLMSPQGTELEGWQTGVALDGSASMRGVYGKHLLGKVPPEIEAEYEQRNWLNLRGVEDGRYVKSFRREAFEDAMQRGYLKRSDNIVQPEARKFISYLAENLDADESTTVIYWACGDGSALEVVGDLKASACVSLLLEGPIQHGFGVGTQLLPALRYFVDRFRDARHGMYFFLTDGRLDDLEEVKAYTIQLAREIAATRDLGTEKRKSVKCVLVGIGTAVDEAQMQELDDLDTGTDVDIWDHKLAAEMRSVVEIFAEVVRENQFVATVGTVYDSNGNLIKRFSDGLPASIRISLPATALWFELEVDGYRIRQNLSVS